MGCVGYAAMTYCSSSRAVRASNGDEVQTGSALVEGSIAPQVWDPRRPSRVPPSWNITYWDGPVSSSTKGFTPKTPRVPPGAGVEVVCGSRRCGPDHLMITRSRTIRSSTVSFGKNWPWPSLMRRRRNLRFASPTPS